MGFGRTVNEQDADQAMKACSSSCGRSSSTGWTRSSTFNRLSEENFQAIARIMLDELVGAP